MSGVENMVPEEDYERLLASNRSLVDSVKKLGEGYYKLAHEKCQCGRYRYEMFTGGAWDEIEDVLHGGEGEGTPTP